MRRIIESEVDGFRRPGVLTDEGGREMVAVFAAARIISPNSATGRRLSRDGMSPAVRIGCITFLEPVDDATLRRVEAAGFKIAPTGLIQAPWAGPPA